MTSDKAMLNVKSTSSAIGGSGRMTIARTASTPTGTPIPVRSRSRIVGIVVVVVAVAMGQCLLLNAS